MSNPQLSPSKTGQPCHYSVGALIRQDGKYLLIDRAQTPYGWAGPAGHIDEGETPAEALIREVREETGLEVTSSKLLFEEELHWNSCHRGINIHHWYLYQCTVQGEIIYNPHESKSLGWYSPAEIKNLKLEPVWHYWFKKLQIINN